MSAQTEAQKQVESIDQIVQQLERVSDPQIQSLFKQLIHSIMDFHGAAVERMLEMVHETGDAGAKLIDEFGRDERVRSLLLLYGLHPLDLPTRVAEAMEKTRPYIQSHGGEVRVVNISDAGAVTLRLEGTCKSCSSSSATLQSLVEKAIYEAAPDVTGIIVENAIAASPVSSGFVPLENLNHPTEGEISNGHSAALGTAETDINHAAAQRSAM